MCFTDIRNNSIIRFYNMRQHMNFPRMTGPHFHNRNFMLRLQSKQCKRYTYMIIKISLCIKNVIFSAQNCCNQFFRCCFAIRSSDTNNTCSQLTPIVIGQLLQSLQAIFNQQNTRIILLCIFRFIHNRIAATFLQSLFCKSITIKVASFQSYKH